MTTTPDDSMTVEQMKKELDSYDGIPPGKSEYPVSEEFNRLSYLRCLVKGGHIPVEIDAGTFSPRVEQCIECGKTVRGEKLDRRRWATKEEIEENRITESGVANNIMGPF